MKFSRRLPRTMERPLANPEQKTMRMSVLIAIAILLAGCSTTVTYVPISWGMGEAVKSLTLQDEFLKVLFNRYDPGRNTLRVSGDSFYEVLTADEAVKKRVQA